MIKIDRSCFKNKMKVGDRFGRLVILRKAKNLPRKRASYAQAWCKCDRAKSNLNIKEFLNWRGRLINYGSKISSTIAVSKSSNK